MNGVISISGMGIICAIGNNQQEVLDALRKKASGIGKMKYLPSVHTDIPVGEIKLSTEEMKQMLGISSNEPVSRTSVMGAIAVREALRQAGIEDVSGKRVALISGTTVGVMDITEQFFERTGSDPELHGMPYSHQCGRSTEEIAMYAGLQGAKCCTICTACSSALNAIMLGSEMLKNDEVDLVVAGGSEPLSKLHLNGFNTLMILDRERCRPFDETRAGLNLGEGAAYVVLQKDAPSGMAYIRFAAEEKELFHLLFMRNRQKEIIPPSDPDLEEKSALIRDQLGLTIEDARQFHLDMWIYVHGIAIFKVNTLVWHVNSVFRFVAVLGPGLIELEEVVSERLADRKAGAFEVRIKRFYLKHLYDLIPCKGIAGRD